MQSQRHPSGMFDKYLQDDSSSKQYQRFEPAEDKDDLTDEATPMPADAEDEEPKEDAPKKGMLPAQHLKMMLSMMEMMQEMVGMFSALLKSKPARKAEKSEDE